jgi:hypothetical protein
MGRCTLHWYATIGMWLGCVTLFGYSSALGVVSLMQIVVLFDLLFSCHLESIHYIYLAFHYWDHYSPKATLYKLKVGLLLAPVWGS